MSETAIEILYRRAHGERAFGVVYEVLSEWQRHAYEGVMRFWYRHELVEHGTYTDDMRQMLDDIKRAGEPK